MNARRVLGAIALGWGLASSAWGQTYHLEFPHEKGELVVKLRAGDIQPVLAAEPALKGYQIHTRELGRGSATHRLTFQPIRGDGELAALAERLARRPEVAFVEANNHHFLCETLPDDPEFGRLYALKGVAPAGGAAGVDIRATFAWDVTTGSRQVVVGVIDTGVDYTHPDLAANIWQNPGEIGLDAGGRDKRTNLLDDDGNGYVDDWHGWDFINQDSDPMDDNFHGTHCAGTLGATGDNGLGITGVNWQVSLVPIKIFDAGGLTNTAALIEAIRYASALGVRLTSNSWGGGPASQGIQEAIAEAERKGILFVAAAGNDAKDNDQSPTYPGGYDLPNIITVSSLTRTGALSGFSNYGYWSVDVAAPGSDIFSTAPGNRYQYLSGTSMATPHVAGLAALLWARYPGLGYAAIKERILYSSLRPAALLRPIHFGLIDAARSLENDTTPPGQPADLRVEAEEPGGLVISLLPSGDDGAAGKVAVYEIRRSAAPIADLAGWNHAEQTYSLPLPPGPDSATGRLYLSFSDLQAGDRGYLTLQALDNVGNKSARSASVFFEIR